MTKNVGSARMPWFDEAWIPGGPDWSALWKLAEMQGGMFTNAEARTCGVRRSLLSYYARRDVFERLARGVYRIRGAPLSPIDRIRAAWIVAGRERAVVSHESALFLHGLLDAEVPDVHLTLPRERRGKTPPRHTNSTRSVKFHMPRRRLPAEDITVREGMRLTTAERAILDSAGIRSDTAVVIGAVRRAVATGMVVPARLLERARERGGRTRWRVERGLSQSGTIARASAR